MFILQALAQDRPWKVKDACVSDILKAVSLHFKRKTKLLMSVLFI